VSGTSSPLSTPSVPRRYALVVFALMVALMLSDYMTRSVISGVLPGIKEAWRLSDAQLGLLVSIVPLVVGIGAWPIALLADRVGYVRSITAMGAIWCLATILCGLSQTHQQMLAARAAVGLGEAAFGAVGGALLASLFAPGRMAAVLGAFQSAAVVGTVLGVVVGSSIAARHGWAAAFVWVGAGSMLLVLLFSVLAREPPAAGGSAARQPAMPLGRVVRSLFSSRTAVHVYLASGFQLMLLGMIGAWMPTFLAREYGLATDVAGARSGLVILMVGIGMILGGAIADRAGRSDGRRKLHFAALYVFASFGLLTAAFAMHAGPLQMTALALCALFAGAPSGVGIAAIIDVTDPRLRATAIATVALFNNLIGLAPGPFLVGLLSDGLGLSQALSIVTTSGLVAALCFVLAARSYARERGAAGSAQRASGTTI